MRTHDANQFNFWSICWWVCTAHSRNSRFVIRIKALKLKLPHKCNHSNLLFNHQEEEMKGTSCFFFRVYRSIDWDAWELSLELGKWTCTKFIVLFCLSQAVVRSFKYWVEYSKQSVHCLGTLKYFPLWSYVQVNRKLFHSVFFLYMKIMFFALKVGLLHTEWYTSLLWDSFNWFLREIWIFFLWQSAHCLAPRTTPSFRNKK